MSESSTTSTLSSDPSECAVCLEPLDETSSIITPWACKHQFHKACIKQYTSFNIRKNTSVSPGCPICDNHDHRITINDSWIEPTEPTQVPATYNSRSMSSMLLMTICTSFNACILTVGLMYVLNLANN